MSYNLAKYCLLAIVLNLKWGGSIPHIRRPQITEDGTKKCISNYYLSGNVCRECPAGYYGDNCSLPCPPLKYGRNCAKQCSCSSASCHHVYGCNINTECPVGYYGDNCSLSCPAPSYGSACGEQCSCSDATCHHVFGCNITSGMEMHDLPQSTTGAIVLTSSWGGSIQHAIRPPIIEDGTKKCITNYYLSGNVCRECPAGYYGDNCSFPCSPLKYGSGCAKECSCSSASCHHVYECNINTGCPVGYYGDNCSLSCPAPSYGSDCAEQCSCSHATCHHVFGCSITSESHEGYDEQRNCSEPCNQANHEVCDCSNTSCHSLHGCITKASVKKEEEPDIKSYLRYKYIRISIITSGTLISISLLLLIVREIYKLSLQGNRQNPRDTQNTQDVDNIYTDIT